LIGGAVVDWWTTRFALLCFALLLGALLSIPFFSISVG
jgi:hypothetical protein